MWKRLPRWMWIGAWFLAFVAGMVNVVGLLGFEHQALTHMTGLTSRFAQDVAEGQAGGVLTVVATMAAFVLGAALSGLMIDDEALALGRRYGVVLGIESMLLAAAGVLIERQLAVGFFVASFACGLQNAMVANFSGSVIRTTHVSGMFTDIGASLGHWLRGRQVDATRLRICASTITGFACGGIAGVVLFHLVGSATLFAAAFIALCLAVAYRKLRRSSGS